MKNEELLLKRKGMVLSKSLPENAGNITSEKQVKFCDPGLYPCNSEKSNGKEHLILTCNC